MDLTIYWNIKKHIFLISFCILSLHYFSQNNTFSGYSRYGIGDIQEKSLPFQKGMNSAGISFPVDTTAPAFLNLQNPATLSYLRLSTIEAGGFYYQTQIINKNNYKVQQSSTNFNALVIGFPIKKHSGFCFGLLPYSFVGYQINQNEYISNIGNVNYVFEGSGGLNNAFASYGFSIKKYFKKQDTIYKPLKEFVKNFSFGLSAQYLFGELANTATVNYPSNSTYYNFVNDQRYRINGITADFGIHSYIILNHSKNSYLNFGLTYSIPSSLLKISQDYIAYNFSYTFFGEKFIVDTLRYAENEIGNMQLPSSTGLGISYIIANKFGIGADLKYTNWNNYHLANTTTNVKNNFEINIGGYYQPDRFATSKSQYFNKVIYRWGAGYNSGYQVFQNKSIPLYSISAGVSLPMGLYRSFSALHLSFQYQMKGQKDFILRENIFKIHIGITLNDRWFIKYKYD
ncbi:MAG: membrane protein [Bacteroidia bacterium]|nr:MAG: membrane protein [Bacteroidia bacterium]